MRIFVNSNRVRTVTIDQHQVNEQHQNAVQSKTGDASKNPKPSDASKVVEPTKQNQLQLIDQQNEYSRNGTEQHQNGGQSKTGDASKNPKPADASKVMEPTKQNQQNGDSRDVTEQHQNGGQSKTGDASKNPKPADGSKGDPIVLDHDDLEEGELRDEIVERDPIIFADGTDLTKIANPSGRPLYTESEYAMKQQQAKMVQKYSSVGRKQRSRNRRDNRDDRGRRVKFNRVPTVIITKTAGQIAEGRGPIGLFSGAMRAPSGPSEENSGEVQRAGPVNIRHGRELPPGGSARGHGPIGQFSGAVQQASRGPSEENSGGVQRAGPVNIHVPGALTQQFSFPFPPPPMAPQSFKQYVFSAPSTNTFN